MKAKKIVRDKTIEKVKPGEIEEITNPAELNHLYYLKVMEELEEVRISNFKDILEFADLIQVAIKFAKINGFSEGEIYMAMRDKSLEKGSFGTMALTNLNPNNISNRIYLEQFTPLDKQIRAIEGERAYYTSRCIYNDHVKNLDSAIRTLKRMNTNEKA